MTSSANTWSHCLITFLLAHTKLFSRYHFEVRLSPLASNGFAKSDHPNICHGRPLNALISASCIFYIFFSTSVTKTKKVLYVEPKEVSDKPDEF